MKTDQVISFEKALETVSESMANFLRFVESTNKWLQQHKLGTAVFDKDDYPEFYHRSGYSIGMFSLRGSTGRDILYFNTYTNGTATGEDLVGSDGKIEGTWYEMCRKVTEVIGALKHDSLSAHETNKLIEKLGE